MAELAFTLTEINIMKHTVGLDNNPGQKGEFYRNRYIASVGHHSYDVLTGLVEKGVMNCSKPIEIFDNDQVFYLNEKGIETVKKF